MPSSGSSSLLNSSHDSNRPPVAIDVRPPFTMKVYFFAAAASLFAISLNGQPTAPEMCISSPGDKTMVSSSGLRWETSTAELKAKYGQMVLRTSYHFTNSSEKPVTIVEIKPSCGCVSTQLDKLDFAPGEKGELKVTLDLEMEEVMGPQRLSIAVTTSDAPSSPATLKLNVQVPEAVELSSDFVTWERGEKAVAKMVSVHAGEGVANLKLSHPTGSSDDFSFEVTPEKEGESYRVRVTPRSTEAPSYAQIRLQAESSSFPRPVICRINLNVK